MEKLRSCTTKRAGLFLLVVGVFALWNQNQTLQKANAKTLHSNNEASAHTGATTTEQSRPQTQSTEDMESKQPQTSAQVPIKTDEASNVSSDLASQPSRPPGSSVLHLITPEQPPLNLLPQTQSTEGMESKQPQTSAQVPIKTDKASNVPPDSASQPSRPPGSSVLHPITPEQPPLNLLPQTQSTEDMESKQPQTSAQVPIKTDKASNVPPDSASQPSRPPGSSVLHPITPDQPPLNLRPETQITENMESKQPQTSAQVPIKTDKASNVQSNLASQPSQPPVSSVLHPITPEQPPLNPALAFRIKSSSEPYNVYEESFPQYGKEEPGQHYRLENNRLLAQPVNREENSVLIICVFNDAESWGKNRTIVDFFELVKSFNYPKEKVSIALLTSSASEYVKVKEHYGHYINLYPRLSVIFRNDFALSGVTRENRHSISLQANRRRMIARYRNYALMLTLETWHQHVVWLDADIKVIPPHLLSRMVYSGLDILTPACYAIFRGRWMYYDQNAWLGQRIVRPPNHGEQTFLPGPLNVAFLSQVDQSKPYTPLDSVGGTMLYVRADVHRQGVLFPVHYIIGSEWGREGYDGIESEGLCYIAHFLGFKCWGMANETIVHTDEK